MAGLDSGSTAKPALRRLAQCRRLAALAMALSLAAFLSGMAPAHAAKVTERSKQKLIAESERTGLQQKLNALKRDIQKTESAKEHAADDLAQSEQTISQANRALHELTSEQRQTQARLNQLAQQHARLYQTVSAQQQQLAKLIREQYVSGNEDRTKLLLSGDNPNRINRELRYLGYVSQAQAKLIESLRANLEDIDSNLAATQNAKDELDEIAQEARDQKRLLEQEKAKRATLLAQLSSRLATQRKEAGNIARNEQRLATLVDRLATLIAEQKKAEAEAARRRAQEAERLRLARQEARRKAAQAKNAAKRAPQQGKTVNPDAIDDDEPPEKLYGRNELTPEPPVQSGVTKRPFASLRGQLRLPVKGELLAKYGSKRDEGPLWKGLFIRTAEGTEVKVVAAGQVVFAEWLRGFGNLIIVDHGNQYMTIYGYNQAVLKRSGDFVNMGDVIASAGNSGGHGQSGLYFEMRYQGRAFDPLGWISFR